MEGVEYVHMPQRTTTKSENKIGPTQTALFAITLLPYLLKTYDTLCSLEQIRSEIQSVYPGKVILDSHPVQRHVVNRYFPPLVAQSTITSRPERLYIISTGQGEASCLRIRTTRELAIALLPFLGWWSGASV